jgi:hypothetical protein
MEEKIINGIKYRLDKDTLTAEVVWNDDEYSGNIVIPGTIVSDTVSYKVTSIGDAAFARCTSLISIIIPDSVTSIGNDAFYECSSLTSITIPKSLTSIGEDAFAGCGCLNSKSTHEHSITVGCGILCFLFPVVGWILHLTWKKEFPEKAKCVEKVAMWGFLLNYAIYLLLVG